jgi:hypothetical protein
MSRAQIHRYVWLLSLIGLAVGLPFSKVILSISGMLLALNWLVEGQFRIKWQRFKSAHWAQLWIAIFLIHLIGLIWTSDFEYAFQDIRTKIPLLLIPLVLGSSAELTKKEWRTLISIFILSVFLASAINWYAFVHDGLDDDMELRNLSLFISHIRFALLVVIALVLSVFLIPPSSRWVKLILGLVSIWFVYYTWFSQVLSGYVSFGLVLLGATIWWLLTKMHGKKRLLATTLIGLTGISLIAYIGWNLRPPVQQEINESSLEWYTASGNVYTHEHHNGLTENGNFIYSYLCMDEIKKEWNKVSSIDFDSTNVHGDPIYGTLIRYMTSKGLRKDSTDFQQLTKQDIHYVEQGIASVVYLRGGMRGRLARLAMDIQKFKEGGDPNGHTVLERLEYWRAGFELIHAHFWFGTGTGDIQQAFQQHYNQVNSQLLPQNRSRTHNQFMTMWITFGVFGFLLFLFTQFYHARKFLQSKNIPALLIWIVLVASYFTEDTLETQTGVTLVAFFTGILSMYKQESYQTNQQ